MDRRIALIVLAELCGTSLWFSGNNAIHELASRWDLSGPARAWLLMAVQLGFIAGTLALAASGLADAFQAHHVFAAAAVLGAAANAGFLLLSDGPAAAIAFRFLTGIALAGVYPLGMKLVVSWAPDRAGMALGWLVGALTAGTATPFLARAVGGDVYWREAVLASSGLAVLGAGLVVTRRRRTGGEGTIRLRLGPGLERVSRPGVSRIGPRLLRPHVGAVRLLGPGPVPGRPARLHRPANVARDVHRHRGRGGSAAWSAGA